VSRGAAALVTLFHSQRHYFHPSNYGAWSTSLGTFTGWVCGYLAREVGAQAARDEVAAGSGGGSCSAGTLVGGGGGGGRGGASLRVDDVTVLVETLLPLAHEMLFSKHPRVSENGEASLKVLALISPRLTAPATLALVLRAVDPVAAVNYAHQTPVAIKALARVLRPLLFPRPHIAPHLPVLLEYTLPGIDANDLSKTFSTVAFYVTLLGWLPVLGGSGGSGGGSGSSENAAFGRLGWVDAHAWPAGTDEAERGDLYDALEGLGCGAMLDWAIAVLDRLFKVLESRGEAAKVPPSGIDAMNTAAALAGGGDAGGGGGFASMMGAAGGHMDLALSYGIFALARSLFFQMDAEALRHACRHVAAWVAGGVHPHAAKSASLVLSQLGTVAPTEAAAALMPVLAGGGGLAAVSAREAAWRLRLLAGLTSGAGPALPLHAAALTAALRTGLASDDRRVRKAACKLLRHALLALTASRPAEYRSLPPSRWANVASPAEWRRVGEPLVQAPVTGGGGGAAALEIRWIEPSAATLRLAAQLLEEFVVGPAELLAS
ncbi:unnamed protein product, partial [Phaeothamnion confervicola]